MHKVPQALGEPQVLNRLLVINRQEGTKNAVYCDKQTAYFSLNCKGG